MEYELDLTEHQQQALIGVALIVAGALSVYVFSGFIDFSKPAENNSQDVEYASPDEDSVDESDKEASAVFSVKSYGVDPYRQEVDLGDTVAFENDREDTVTINFDSSDKEFVLEPGERSTLLVKSITYVDLESDTGWTGRAQIYLE